MCPGNRPDMIAKLPRAGADGVVLDLEDGVPAGEKEAARRVALEGAAALGAEHPELAVFVRVNGPGSPWVEEDIAAGVARSVAGVVLPKLESVEQLRWTAGRLDRAGLHHAVIVGGLESAAGVEEAPRVGHPRLAAMYFGAEDFIADVGGERTAAGHEVAYARSRVALAVRLLGVAGLDQVVVEVRDDARFMAEATQARQLGYAGKVCLHPAQVALANDAFTPGAEAVERARRLLAAVAAGETEGRGVVLFEDQMVDLPAIRQARRVIELAGAGGTANTGIEKGEP